MLEELVELLLSKKAEEVVTLDLRGVSAFADFFIISSAESTKQSRALVESLNQKISSLGIVPYGIEGEEDSRWILYDLGDIVIHIFTPELRAFYDLENLWSQAKKKVYL
ncbi:MAG: ribosome silencing factor [Caldiserica bacterium]|nr:ribosome silencing factor [Caldisericota bacterium]MDH7563162.1 ribosome silencing factor [Caldisericota bacterium]